MPAQITQLQQYLAAARRTRPGRNLDLVLLTVGANDIDFSGLVANVIIDSTGERVLFGTQRHLVGGVCREARWRARCRRASPSCAPRSSRWSAATSSRVVFVSYGHPALRADGTPCAGGQAGFDVHPAFKLDGERLRRVADFVGARFLPALKAIAQCTGRDLPESAPTA